MELLDIDLEAFMNNRARIAGTWGRPILSFQSTLDVLLQVAEAMNYLHEKNIVHEDLEPSNILMNCYPLKHSGAQFYVVKVCDFSMSQRVHSLGATMDCWVGTSRYSAPEVLDFQYHRTGGKPPEHPKKVDVYSFGVVAYQVLTGVLDFYKGLRFAEARKQVI